MLVRKLESFFQRRMLDAWPGNTVGCESCLLHIESSGIDRVVLNKEEQMQQLLVKVSSSFYLQRESWLKAFTSLWCDSVNTNKIKNYLRAGTTANKKIINFCMLTQIHELRCFKTSS